jgi:hypothetical protein
MKVAEKTIPKGSHHRRKGFVVYAGRRYAIHNASIYTIPIRRMRDDTYFS